MTTVMQLDQGNEENGACHAGHHEVDAGDEDEKKHMENARAEIAQSTDYESPWTQKLMDRLGGELNSLVEGSTPHTVASSSQPPRLTPASVEDGDDNMEVEGVRRRGQGTVCQVFPWGSTSPRSSIHHLWPMLPDTWWGLTSASLI